jgi:multidrug resistance efflux pump
MRVTFHNSTYVPVLPTTDRVADVHRPLRPLRMLGIFAAAIAALALWLVVSGGPVRTYGVVSSATELLYAPIRSRVVSLHVEPGDRIAPDALLYVLVSDDAQAELVEASERRSRAQRDLDAAMAAITSVDDQHGLIDLRLADDRRDSAERRRTEVRAECCIAGWRRRQALTAAVLQRERRCIALTKHVQALSEIRRLGDLGAATRAEIAATEDALAEARIDAGASTAGIHRACAADCRETAIAAAAIASVEAQLAQAGAFHDDLVRMQAAERDRRRAAATMHAENLRSELAASDARVAYLRTLAGPTEVRALNDGVVMDVAATVGSTVPKDGMILSIAGGGRSWVAAYVSSTEATRVALGRRAWIERPDGGGRVAGRVTAGGGLEYKVHPALRDRIADFSAVYVRVDLECPHAGLIPGNVVRVVIED